MTLDELNDLDPKLVAIMALGLWEGETDSDGVPCIYRNHYYCEECDHDWQMEWTCACDDDCPECSGTYTPVSTDEWDFAKDDWDNEELS